MSGEEHDRSDVEAPAVIDVVALVEDIQRQARQRRGGGMPVSATERIPGVVSLRADLGYSSKPVVGPAITGVKRLLMRLNWTVWSDLVSQINAELESLRAAAVTEARRREDLETAIATLERRVDALRASD